jgi:hypothetical protein
MNQHDLLPRHGPICSSKVLRGDPSRPSHGLPSDFTTATEDDALELTTQNRLGVNEFGR